MTAHASAATLLVYEERSQKADEVRRILADLQQSLEKARFKADVLCAQTERSEEIVDGIVQKLAE